MAQLRNDPCPWVMFVVSLTPSLDAMTIGAAQAFGLKGRRLATGVPWLTGSRVGISVGLGSGVHVAVGSGVAVGVSVGFGVAVIVGTGVRVGGSVVAVGEGAGIVVGVGVGGIVGVDCIAAAMGGFGGAVGATGETVDVGAANDGSSGLSEP